MSPLKRRRAVGCPLAVVAVLLLHLISNTTSATDHPKFQSLNVEESIRSSLSVESINDEIDDDDVTVAERELKKPIKVNLVHRDYLPSSSGSGHLNLSQRFSQRMRRDVIRVAALTRRLSNVGSDDVVSGIDQGSGEYFVRIGVGSPPRPQYVVIDTGSDVVWVQCQPCSDCYKQSDPVFDPAESGSFSSIACRSEICEMVDSSDCRSGRCQYEVLYSDGSYTKGTLALETLTIGSTQIRNVAIGCGHVNRGMFVSAAGLLGLGGSSLSLVRQLGGQMGGAFSYCLVSRGSSGSGSSTGYLVFGRDSLPAGAAWISLIRNSQAPSFYYIGLSGLAVGGVRVPVSESVFDLTETGDGGVVMDTGTAVSRLPTEAYVALRDSFVQQTGNLPRTAGVAIFDTCYDLSGFVSVRVPTVSFYFKDGPELTLPATSFLVPVGETGTFCLAFAASGSALSIVGNIQQEGIQISVDAANGFVGFGPNVC